jgi:thiamine-phosphate diphosphorylase
MSGQQRPAIPRLHLVGPLGVLAVPEYVDVAAALVGGGVDAVHARLPEGTGGEVLQLARELRARIGSAVLIVNDRLDVAQLARADGVQLGERSFRVEDARALLGPAVLVGRSVHDPDGAREAERAGADFVLAGHVFETPSKAGTPGRGLDWLREVATAVAIPVIAIGGITQSRIPQVLAAGGYGVAIGRELLQASEPEQAARAARLALDAVGAPMSPQY